MLVEYAVPELDPELEPMCGQLELDCCRCCCVFGVLVDGATFGVVVEGVVLPVTADQATPAPIVSPAMTTSITTSLSRAMAASFP